MRYAARHGSAMIADRAAQHLAEVRMVDIDVASDVTEAMTDWTGDHIATTVRQATEPHGKTLEMGKDRLADDAGVSDGVLGLVLGQPVMQLLRGWITDFVEEA